MATHTTRPTNGVSYGYVHTVSAQDDTDGSVVIDFQVDDDLVASVMVTTGDAQGQQIVDVGDMKLDYPEAGQVRIQDGDSSFTLTEGDQLHIIAQRRSNGITFSTFS